MGILKSPVEDENENRRLRGIYLLPNLLTTCGLFGGFYAIVAAMNGLFNIAAIAVFVAMIADGMDGRVARLTNTQSAFGAQYDSLSDLVAFGIAPALVVYSWSLVSLGKIGWLIAFCFAVAGALRLARFNVTSSSSKRYFQGLPIPSAAAIVTSLVWMGHHFHIAGKSISLLVALITIVVAMLMVSNVRFHSFKELDFKGRVPFSKLILVVIIIVFIAIDPPTVLFVCFMLYGFSGPLMRYRRIMLYLNYRRQKKLKL
ncbi:MAG: CDP-diacylglycerol--serine O-phosphatidyltransferase [Legionellales bacterium]|nr:CDP-diacylglycerol--serine O-phosphatidyltransferase [Legionellales bacterium]